MQVVYDDDDVVTMPRPMAPSREEIDQITTVRAAVDMAIRTEDVVEEIEVQLKYLDQGSEIHHRRVSALIHWKRAFRCAKRRIKELSGPAQALGRQTNGI
jgi:hypothetical protein